MHAMVTAKEKGRMDAAKQCQVGMDGDEGFIMPGQRKEEWMRRVSQSIYGVN